MKEVEMPSAAGAPAQKRSKPSFARGLFAGRVDEDLIFPFPQLAGDEAEALDMVLAEFHRFAGDHLDGAAFDQRMEIPQEFIGQLGDLGVLGFTVPEEYGGSGFSTGAYCRLMQAVCRYCAATATVIGGHQSIGIKGIVMYGSEEQKREFLPRMASGEWIGAYALTEAGSGSDAAAMTTRAVYDAAGDVWIINGSKQWITNGGFSQVFTVFARTPAEPGSKPTQAISCFLVKRDLPGVSTTPPMHKMGIRGSNTVDVVFDNVRVPAGHMLGRQGQGFKMAMEILNTGRLSLASGCIGSAREMIDASVKFALERKAFGATISELEMIRHKFALMMSETYAAEAMVYLTTGLCDRGGLDFSIESAMSKTFAGEVLWRVVNHAVQINGGNGYMSEYPYERFLRDARINMIFEGTNEIMRLYIFMAGMRDTAAAATVGSLTRVHPALAAEAEVAAAMTRMFAGAMAKTLARHGRELPARGYVQERAADAIIDLYALLAVLSRCTARLEADGEEGAARDVTLTRLFARQARDRFERNIGLLDGPDDELLTAASEVAYRDGGYRLI
ncbi:MAG: acyl-CoA dehydrogenase [Acidobacteria bacterium]|nr:MAG: acyl-CoA dehydrogenase [Acidobacteriota bacterium]